ncbi:MAG: hypothetical protein KDI82_00050 [Gammaproteobacteria bacterium]|nr:hypothetical protein [Gammaproteobacteria bacterium]
MLKSFVCVLVAAAVFHATTAYAAPVTVDFAIPTSTPTVGSFTFDSSLDGSVLGYADLDAFSITLWTGSSYDLTFVTTGTFAVNEFAFDTSSDSFVNLDPQVGLITAVRSDFSAGFFVSALDEFCSASLPGPCVADYPGAIADGGGVFDDVAVERVNGVPVSAPTTFTLLAFGMLVHMRRRCGII